MKRTPVIGEYQIESLLGAGGSAEVWRGSILLPPGLRQDCALKRLKGEFAERPVYQHRLKRELDVGLAVTRDHPNLVTTQTSDVIAGRTTIVMELVVGSSLAQLRAQLDFETVRYLAAEVLAALDYLAEKGVVHRDISPANILIDKYGRVRIADFGMATWAEGDSWHGDVLGTEPYQAPEARNGSRFGCEADLYAFGRILWELLTGNTEAPALPRNTPKDLRDIINGLLAPKPQQRWSANRSLVRLAHFDRARTAKQLGRLARGEVLGDSKASRSQFARHSLLPPYSDIDSARRASTSRLGWLSAAAIMLAAGSIGGLSYLERLEDNTSSEAPAPNTANLNSPTPQPALPSLPTTPVRASRALAESSTFDSQTNPIKGQRSDSIAADNIQSANRQAKTKVLAPAIRKRPRQQLHVDVDDRVIDTQNDSMTRRNRIIARIPDATRVKSEQSKSLTADVSDGPSENEIETLENELGRALDDPRMLTLVSPSTIEGQLVVLLIESTPLAAILQISAVGMEVPEKVRVVDRSRNCSTSSYEKKTSGGLLVVQRAKFNIPCKLRIIFRVAVDGRIEIIPTTEEITI